MIEEIEDFLIEKYNYLTIEIEKGKKINEYIFYISIRLTDFNNYDIVKAIQFNFSWNRFSTNDSNFRQLSTKIEKSILKFFMKEV